MAHTYEVQRALGDYRLLTERVETARRGYLLSRDDGFDRTYRQAAGALPGAVAHIRALTSDNPVQQRNVARLSTLTRDQLVAAEFSVAAARAGRAQFTAFDHDPAVATTRQIRTLTQAMDAEEQQKLTQRDAVRREALTELTRALIAAGILLAVVGVVSVTIIVRFTRALTVSRDQLRALNEGLEDEVRARTADLQRANDEIQRFAYIVSHDLRSPLVNIMGFTSELEAAAKPLGQFMDRAEAEIPALVTRDARAAVREDLPEAIRFIRTSTQKMDALINAILRLSREGRRVLTPEPVDMAALFNSVAGTLKHRSDELGATIEVQAPLPTVVSDRLALEQIFANLTENALKYLAPGRPGRIAIRGEARPGGRVIFEIEDNGRGVDPKDHERIFELFRRAGAQDQPGEGIGLAHVRALAYRLGGTVTVESTLDRGSTFRVSLPSKLSLEGSPA